MQKTKKVNYRADIFDPLLEAILPLTSSQTKTELINMLIHSQLCYLFKPIKELDGKTTWEYTCEKRGLNLSQDRLLRIREHKKLMKKRQLDWIPKLELLDIQPNTKKIKQGAPQSLEQ